MRTIYSPYKNKNNQSEPASGSLSVKKERESLSSQTLGTCPTWTSTDDNNSLQLEQSFSHESNAENKDPVAPKSTTKERKQWIENALLTKKEYTPFNTPAREEYCRNKSNRELTTERKHWIETTLLTKEQKTYYNTKIREEYCKNMDNHELTNERKRWIEETLLTKTNMLPSTPSNKRLKSEEFDVKENATGEIEEEGLAPVAERQRQFRGPSEIDGELLQKLKKRAEAEANPSEAVEKVGSKGTTKPVKIDGELMQKLKKRAEAEAEVEESPNAAEGARQSQLFDKLEVEARKRQEEEEVKQRQLIAEKEARQLQLMKDMEVESRQRQEEEMRQRQLMVEEEARQQQRMAEEEAARQRQFMEEESKRMEQERINEEAKLAEEAIAALQKRLDEERVKRELLEEEARLAKEARDAEHERFVELAESAKLYETRIGELEQQEQQRSKMRAYISTLKEEKKLRADELAIVEELEKDIESEDEAADDEDAAEQYKAYLSNYSTMNDPISIMGSNNIFALTHQTGENDALSTGSDLSSSICPTDKTEHLRSHIGVQPDMPRRTPMVIRSVGSFTDLEEMKQATSVKKHKKRMKLLQKLVKLLSRAKKQEC